MTNKNSIFIENGGFKSSLKDGRSKKSFFYADGQPKISGLRKDHRPKIK